MQTSYLRNRNYTYDEITTYLDRLKICVRHNRFTVSSGQDRQKNNQFLLSYRINRNKQKRILMSLKPEDFCYTKLSTNPRFFNHVLYVFTPSITVDDQMSFNDTGINLTIYIKTDLMEMDSVNTAVIVISFHEAEHYERHLFESI